LNNTQLKNEISNFLKEHKSGSLATIINDVPRSSPVQYYLGDNMNLYITSAGGEKFKAIDQNNNVCLLVNTNYLDYTRIKGVQIFGKAQTSPNNPALINEAKKYIYDNSIIDKNDLKIIKIEPREIVYLNSIDTGERIKKSITV
jgi:uncharacterized protein